MCNYKALGIDRDMNVEFNNYENKTELQLLMDSSYFESPYITNKQKEASYCNIEVTSCKHKDWWYRDLIGMHFFCRIVFERHNDVNTKIKEFVGVKLTNSKEIIFRHFDPSDVIIV